VSVPPEPGPAEAADGAEGIGETVGEARWRALRELRAGLPDGAELDEADVRFEVVSEGRRTMLGRTDEPARVIARLRSDDDEAPAPPPLPEGAGAAALAAALEAVLAGLALPGRVAVTENSEGTLVGEITGCDAGLLIGKHGETIDAVQYLAAQIVRRAEGGSRRRVVVDAEGYRARRAARLESLALRAAKEAIQHGEEIELDPMGPHERRIIHLALESHPGVVTRSEGEEPRRRVIVEPVDEDAPD
jgi:spoIIIJ-associated protein